jgi:hypothetical protein
MTDPLPRLDCEALYTAVDRERRRRRVRGNREVLRQAGIGGSSLLTRLGQGHPPAADNLVKLLAWLGSLDLTPYVTTEPADDALAATTEMRHQ